MKFRKKNSKKWIFRLKFRFSKFTSEKMREDPNEGVIRLQISDATASTISLFDSKQIGNNEWQFCIDKTTNESNENHLKVRLMCNRTMCSNVWSCNASIRFSLVKLKSEKDSFGIDFTKIFKRNDDEIEIPEFITWAEFMDPENGFVMENAAEVEVYIKVNTSIGKDKLVLETFGEPDEHLTDVVLVVEGKKCHVGKQILAANSKFFRYLFYSDFKESKEAEISIEDVVHSEFVDLLNCIYPTNFDIDVANVAHILKLADRFEMRSIIQRAEKFLVEDCTIHLIDKLKFAETYGLAQLQGIVCDSLKLSKNILDLTKHERYKDLGDVSFSLLFQHLAEISKGK